MGGSHDERDRHSPTGGPTGEVMAAIDEDGGNARLVIADVSKDESWVAASTDASVSVAEVR